MDRRLNIRTVVIIFAFVFVKTIVVSGGDIPVHPGIIGKYRNPDFVDVYYERNPAVTGEIHVGKAVDIPQPQGFLPGVEAGRKWVICESAQYRARVDRAHPHIAELKVGGVPDMLGPKGLWMEVEDDKGIVYSSVLAPKEARQNTWRAGIYFYDMHLEDFHLGSADGSVAPIQGELTLHCFPDKINIQAIFHMQEKIMIKRAELICDVSGMQETRPGSMVFGRGDAVLGIAGGAYITGNGTVRAVGLPMTWVPDNDHIWDADRFEIHMALFPDVKSNGKWIENCVLAELNPLTKEHFQFNYATFQGYDAGRGLYIIYQTPSAQRYNFWKDYGQYLKAEVRIRNDGIPRRIYIIHDEGYIGYIQAGVLTDTYGFPLPLPVQCSKSWNGDGGEDVDPGFGETYYPVDLEPHETKLFNSLHLHDTWGDHKLRQVSSIMFYQIYYHLSHGARETTCFCLPTKFAAIPSGVPRAYNTCDVRPLSGVCGQHVALQAWLQYLDGNNCWQWPRYNGSTIISNGPNLAWLIMNYESSDGKVDECIELFEMPQSDESRTFVRIRYDFKDTITINGDTNRNIALVTSGSYIRKVNWDYITWTGVNGEMRTIPIKQDGNWTAEGVEIRPVNSFVATYPHIDGNYSIVVRSFKGEVNGAPFNRIGFSLIMHEDNETELLLVPLLSGNTINKGSWFELDCILVPYGDESSNYHIPWLESARHGLNDREIKDFLPEKDIKKMKMKLFGPKVEVSHGHRILDMPPTVEAEDNWASFVLSGGHDRASLVVKGFKARKVPLLWQGDQFVNNQRSGGDGYQVIEDANGTYTFVFAVPTETSRSTWSLGWPAQDAGNEVWSTTSAQYFVTQAISEAEISSVKTRYVDEVEITVDGPGETVIDSPRIWSPAENQLDASRSVNRARTTAGRVITVPVGIEGAYNHIKLTVDFYTSDCFRMNINANAAQDVAVVCNDLRAGSRYEVDVDGVKTVLEADSNGRITVPVKSGNELTVHGTVF